MKKFRTLQLATLIDIQTDFTDHYKRMFPVDFKTQEFKDLKVFIVSIRREIKRRQTLKLNG